MPVFLLTLTVMLLSVAGERVHLEQAFQQEVDRRLEVPEDEQLRYAEQLSAALAPYNLHVPQYVVLVDRSEFVQAAMIYWMSSEGTFEFIGASPVSTGKPGRFDHFTSPTGVFEHTVANPDFRALGTRNQLGFRGYGRAGMRVYDFGWQKAERGWGHGGESNIRLQMHATDPDRLEKRMGTAQSKGCIRIPSTLNSFLDHHGILDADYEAALEQGKSFWVLSKKRDATAWSGRFLVIVDSMRSDRPDWSPLSEQQVPRGKAQIDLSSPIRRAISEENSAYERY